VSETRLLIAATAWTRLDLSPAELGPVVTRIDCVSTRVRPREAVRSLPPALDGGSPTTLFATKGSHRQQHLPRLGEVLPPALRRQVAQFSPADDDSPRPSPSMSLAVADRAAPLCVAPESTWTSSHSDADAILRRWCQWSRAGTVWSGGGLAPRPAPGRALQLHSLRAAV
jgi:hypothetical protein